MIDLVPLLQAHCVAKKGAEHRLGDVDIRNLMTQLENWSVIENGHAIERTFTFPDYYKTMAFVNALAHIAHREDHHPDCITTDVWCVIPPMMWAVCLRTTLFARQRPTH